MTTVPDPTVDTSSTAAVYFRSVFKDEPFVYNRSWKTIDLVGSKYSYTWNVALASQYASITTLTPVVRAKIQKLLPKSLTITVLTLLYNECDDPFLKITLKYTKPSLPRAQLRHENHTTHQVLVKNKIDGRKFTLPLSDYNSEEHLPCQLIENWKKCVTKRFTGRRSLTVKIFDFIKDKLQLGANRVKQLFKSLLLTMKKKIEPIIFVPQSNPLEPPQTVVVPEPPGRKMIKPHSYSAIPFNYDDQERLYQFSKLTDTKNFYMVRRYIIQQLGIPGYGQISPVRGPTFSTIELANYIRSVGLPLDESLRQMYFEYCKSRGISDDAAGELKEYALSLGK